MATPVTKREMEATFDAFLAVLMERLDKRFEQVDKRFEHLDKRFEQIDKRFEQARIEMIAVVDHMADTLREEMRELSKTDLRAIRDDLEKYDDKYSDLPGRVTRLETAVFKPTPLKRRRTR
jgi:hypothetical protein